MTALITPPAASTDGPGAAAPFGPTAGTGAPGGLHGTGVETGKRRIRLRGGFLLVLGAAAIAGFAALAGKLQGELLVAVALFVVFIGDLVGALTSFGRHPHLDVELAGDTEVGVNTGGTLTVSGASQALWVRIGWWRPRWFTLEPDSPGWIDLLPHSRGSIRWLDVDLVARGPLGLWQVGRRDRIFPARPANVGPHALEHRLQFPPIRAKPFGETVLTRGADDITRGVREYRPGDPRKLVHWPASAHHGRLLVRETETLGTIRVRIAVHTPVVGPASEVTLGRAAWLVRDCIARGWEVELVTTERLAPPPPSPLLKSPFGGYPQCSLVQDGNLNWGMPWAPTWAPAGQGRGPLPLRTRVDDVRSVDELAVRLAAVVAGPLELPPSRVTTRIVSPNGDEWQ